MLVLELFRRGKDRPISRMPSSAGSSQRGPDRQPRGQRQLDTIATSTVSCAGQSHSGLGGGGYGRPLGGASAHARA